MPIVTDDALILQVFRYSESSKILRLLTRAHGVRSAMARGAMRPRSRFGGVLEPFTQGVATLHLRDDRELHSLTGFDLARVRRGLGEDLVRFGGASLIAELLVRAVSEEAQPLLFERVCDALERLESAPEVAVESILLAEVWGIVAFLGFEPEMSVCVLCSRPIADDEATVFDYAAGGIRCSSCAHGASGGRIPAGARRDLHRMARGEVVPLTRTQGHWMLLSRFLDYHVLEGSRLRSLEFLAETLREST